MQARCSVEVVHSDEDLSSLADDWNRLSENVEPRNAFSTYGWFRAWTQHFTTEDRTGSSQPYVLVLKQGGKIVGISPFKMRIASRLAFPVRKLEFVTIHADYNQLVLGNNEAGLTDVLVDYLARTSSQWDLVDLRDLPDIGDGNALLKRALARNGLHFGVSAEENSCPYLPIDGDAAHHLKKLSGHVRRVLRRRSEQAESEGFKVRMIEHPEQEPGLLETMIALESKKHLRSEYPPFLAGIPDVFQALFDSLGPRGWLYVALLERGTEAIAFQFGFRCGDKLWDYNKAYDSAYSRIAPGTLLLPPLIDYCFQHGYREYDFLRGEEPYKLVWSTGSHCRSRYLIWNRRWLSRMRKFVYVDLKPALYRLVRRKA